MGYPDSDKWFSSWKSRSVSNAQKLENQLEKLFKNIFTMKIWPMIMIIMDYYHGLYLR